MKPIKQELQDRWLLYQVSNEKIFDLLDKWWVNFYLGFDPSADSLHLWNFIWFMVAIHIMRRWNTYTALTGWATGMIWDPGWKSSERNFLDEKTLDHNQKMISKQITHIAENLEKFTWDNFKYRFVNNLDFYKDMLYTDFLREVGKYITVNVMMGKDTVKKRIEDPNQSISYTEFSYMLMQWYDYTKMYKEDNMILQIWGQDQWWNLVTWTEIIRKKYEAETYALTWPLITDSTWKKFGKSEWNAMFLDKNKTSPYFIYQYFVNTNDEDLSKYMKMLTLIETEEIDEIIKKHMKNPEKREWQKLLAYKVIEIVHNKKEALLCQEISEFMFGENNDRLEILKWLDTEDLKTFKDAMWGFFYDWENLLEAIVKSWLASSNSEARKSVESWAIYINEEKITDIKYDISKIFNEINVVNAGLHSLLIRKWKKNFKLILG